MYTFTLAKQVEDYVIKLRRDFHAHPELGLQEHRTIAIVLKELRSMGIEYEIIPNGGIIGIIRGGILGKTLILRADMDALPMQEAVTNLKTKKVTISENTDVAHTCGHDGHTAMLLGAAQILSQQQEQFRGIIILVFEQDEEMGRAISNLLPRLIEMGADGIWGIHLKSDIPSGKISVDPGPRMASTFPFHVLLKGKGGHGSRPDLVHSPLDCFVDLYQRVKMMRLTELDPFQPITFSVGKVMSGEANNIIPDTLEFSGTFRYLHAEQGRKAAKLFKQLLVDTCSTYNCTFEFVESTEAMELFVENDEEHAAIAAEAVLKSIGHEALYHYPAWMASETFSSYQQHFPGIFAFLGIQNEEKGTGAEHHNPHFDIDDEVLKLGVAVTVEYAIAFLNK